MWQSLVEILPGVVGSRCESWLKSYVQFSWRRVDVLDMLLLGWIALAFLVIGLVNVYLRIFGRPKCLRRSVGGPLEGGAGSNSYFSGKLWNSKYFSRDGGESTVWVNAVLSWVLQNSACRPQVIGVWLAGAAAEANKHTVRFIG